MTQTISTCERGDVGMSIKEDFRGYREAVRTVEVYTRRLKNAACVMDTVKGSSAEWPFTKQTVTICGHNAAEETRMREKIAECKARCRRVEEAISKAPNEKIRCILTLHYIEGFSWAETAELWAGDDLNAPGEKGVQKIAERYIGSL